MKRRNTLCVALLAMAWLTSGSAWAQHDGEHSYTNGICTIQDCTDKYQPAEKVDGTYLLTNVGNVEWMSEQIAVNAKDADDVFYATASYKLTADIDYAGLPANAHKPIGPNTQIKFDGVFDGQHYRIKNMIIDNELENQAFFGCVRGNAIIKNVIIDKTCSVTAGKRAAGLIGTLQTAADGKCRILNCVNEANVTSVSGVAAGIIGAGQSNYAFFKMHNCINTGNITGASNDKAAAFNGWCGDTGGKGNSQVWNCFNMGELTPLDGTSTFLRGTFRSVQNSYDAVNNGGQGIYVSAEDIASGRLCYLLNQGETEGISFKQEIGVDPYPMPVADGPLVYEVADYYCDGTPKGSVAYSNTEGGSRDEHVKGDNYICVNCNNYVFDGIEGYKTPEADGFYHLSTVDDVEWFSHMVRDKGHGAMKVKLDNDIDFQGVLDAHLPIGTSAHKFFGHFDGQGHRIKGMVLTPASRLENRGFDGNGFFGSVRGGGTDANGTVTNEVIIENLIIDASCSIQHDNNFAAGVVAHINSRNDEQSNIIIRNCGNEANVSTTGKNAAGILGCVEGTNVGLKLYNLWNKGNIKGGNGESAAICAWTGQRNVNGEVDVEGCWNIGEVTGVDGNGYNLIRRNSNIVPRNMVDLCTTNAGKQGKVSVLNTEDPISSGELCYLLNGDQTDIVYYQTLGTDAMPVYRDATHGQVYQSGTVDCAGAATGSFGYNNVGGETVQLPHTMNDEIGICTTCYAHYQEPAKDGDYYLLKNAGNVEWLSNAIANGGGAAFYAKLMNDIDFLNIENLHNPLGPSTGAKFKGVFDGQGYSIKNMIINRPTVEAQGFFGWLQGNDNTTIKNLIIDSSCSIIGANKCGGLAGASQNESNVAKITIENVVNEADVTVSGQDAAGIVGGETGGKATYYIHNVVNTGTITSTHQFPYAGALFCYQEKGAIENFLNLGKIVGHDGGNIGRFGGTWTNVVDLSETDNKTQSVREDLTPEDIVNGKLAYVMGFKQLIGTDEYPSPLNADEVNYVGDAGYATMYDKANDWALNGDATAHIAAFDGEYLQLTEVEDVPAGAAVILKGSYYNKLATTATSDVTANELLGTDADTEADGTMYVLAQPEGEEVGFYLATGTIAAGKAYYQSTSGVKAFYFGNGDATGISDVNVDANLNENGAIYNIAGQRLNKVQKGINIINGKKVLY